MFHSALGSGKGIFFIKKKSCKSDLIQTFGFTKKFVGGGWEAKLNRTQLYWTIHNFNSNLRVEKGFLRFFSRVIVLIVVPVTSSWFIDKFSDLQRDSVQKWYKLIDIVTFWLRQELSKC